MSIFNKNLPDNFKVSLMQGQRYIAEFNKQAFLKLLEFDCFSKNFSKRVTEEVNKDIYSELFLEVDKCEDAASELRKDLISLYRIEIDIEKDQKPITVCSSVFGEILYSNDIFSNDFLTEIFNVARDVQAEKKLVDKNSTIESGTISATRNYKNIKITASTSRYS